MKFNLTPKSKKAWYGCLIFNYVLVFGFMIVPLKTWFSLALALTFIYNSYSLIKSRGVLSEQRDTDKQI